MKRVLVIAGGKWQVPLLKKLKELNLEIVCSNLYADSPGFAFADFSEVADVRDQEKNLLIAKKYNVDAVFTDQSDIAVPTAAYVAQVLGLKTIGIDLAELFTNKYKMREYLKQHDFPFPEFKICTKLEEAKDFFVSLNCKAIIKPLDSQSSRGIYEITTLQDLENNFELSKLCSKDKTNVLIERYVKGTEFTVDGIVIEGKHYSLAISEKSHYDFNQNIADALYFSHKNEQYDYGKLRKINDQIINESGLPFGLTHAEYKYENGQFYLIEMAARGGGTKISSDIVPYLTGIDNYSLWIKSMLGDTNETPVISPEYEDRHMVLQFLDHEISGRKIKSIQGIDEIKKLSEVIDFGLNIQVGDILEKATDDSNRIGYYIASGNSKEELIQLKVKIMSLLSITFE